MNFAEYFMIFVIVIILVLYTYKSIENEVEYVKSEIDGKLYLVRSLPDKQTAANTLSEINADIINLIKHLLAKYPDDPRFNLLYKNYDPSAISEGTHESGFTSYSVNKGEKLIICIRHTDYSFVEKNVVMYPVIHEIAHLATSEIGHTKTFWNNFKFILSEAIGIGIYQKIDFKSNPTDYCNIQITSSVV
jgi:hypothetical protein